MTVPFNRFMILCLCLIVPVFIAHRWNVSAARSTLWNRDQNVDHKLSIRQDGPCIQMPLLAKSSDANVTQNSSHDTQEDTLARKTADLLRHEGAPPRKKPSDRGVSSRRLTRKVLHSPKQRAEFFFHRSGVSSLAEARLALMQAMDGPHTGLKLAVTLAIVGIALLALVVSSWWFRFGSVRNSLRLQLDPIEAPLRTLIIGLPVRSWHDVNELMTPASGSEWSLSSPLSSHQLVRFEVKVVTGNGGMISPISRQRCVAWAVRASLDYRSPPLLQMADSIDLTVMPLDEPLARVRIAATHVKLCNMLSKLHTQRGTLAQMPSSWQGQALSENKDKATLSVDTVLEFRECIVDVGSHLTLVGELHRDGEGVLRLRPYEDPFQNRRDLPKGVETFDTASSSSLPKGIESFDTASSSKDHREIEGLKPGASPENEKTEKAITSKFVLASDDTTLFDWS